MGTAPTEGRVARPERRWDCRRNTTTGTRNRVQCKAGKLTKIIILTIKIYYIDSWVWVHISSPSWTSQQVWRIWFAGTSSGSLTRPNSPSLRLHMIDEAVSGFRNHPKRTLVEHQRLRYVQCESKKSPPGFSENFSQTVGNF